MTLLYVEIVREMEVTFGLVRSHFEAEDEFLCLNLRNFICCDFFCKKEKKKSQIEFVFYHKFVIFFYCQQQYENPQFCHYVPVISYYLFLVILSKLATANFITSQFWGGYFGNL